MKVNTDALSLHLLTATRYLKWKKKGWMFSIRKYNKTRTVISFMCCCSGLQYSLCGKLHTLPHGYSQLSARRIKHDMQAWPEQETRRGRERVKVSHPNIHHLAECHF